MLADVGAGAHIRRLMCVLVFTTRGFAPSRKEGIMKEIYRIRTFASAKEYTSWREAKEEYRAMNVPCTLEQKIVNVWVKLDAKRPQPRSRRF